MSKKDRSVEEILDALRSDMQGEQDIPNTAITAEQAATELALPKQQAIYALTKLCNDPDSGWKRAKRYGSRTYVYWKV